jgi:UDP-N-acetylglucosamine 2-epimerase
MSDTYGKYLVALGQISSGQRQPIVDHIDTYVAQRHRDKAHIERLEAALREICTLVERQHPPLQVVCPCHPCECMLKGSLSSNEYCRQDRAAFEKLQLDQGIRSGSVANREVK